MSCIFVFLIYIAKRILKENVIIPLLWRGGENSNEFLTGWSFNMIDK